MATIGEEAQAYEPQRMKNIADLEVVSVKQEIKKETRQDKDKNDYTVSFIVVNGEEHRVPNSVLEQLQTLIKEKPEMTAFKVTKKGEGLNTSSQVISLD
jgi:hypothetical protein